MSTDVGSGRLPATSLSFKVIGRLPDACVQGDAAPGPCQSLDTERLAATSGRQHGAPRINPMVTTDMTQPDLPERPGGVIQHSSVGPPLGRVT